MISKRPGGELASRPLHFIWLADCSGSMSIDGKIQASIVKSSPPCRYITTRLRAAESRHKCRASGRTYLND